LQGYLEKFKEPPGFMKEAAKNQEFEVGSLTSSFLYIKKK
jgi:hypothetical protein